MTVPNIFANSTTAIPLVNLDQNFNTGITLGNTTVFLGNTTTTLGNVTLTGANLTATTLNTTGNTTIFGTTTNNSATAGYVGELIDSSVTGATITVSEGNITSISLTAGDWDVSMSLTVAAIGSTNTWIKAGISQTTNTITGTQGKDWTYTNGYGAVLNPPCGLAIPRLRVSLSSTTTIYAVARTDTGNTGSAAAIYISARRIR